MGVTKIKGAVGLREEVAADEVDRLRAENTKLRAALEFYADEKNYRLNAPLDPNSSFFDGPTRARTALAGISERTPLMNKEMMAALEADGEKLRQLTGVNHGPVFIGEDDNMSPEASLMNVRDEMRAEINDLRKAIEIAELMFRRFKGKITGDEAAAMMRASIETTLRARTALK